MITLSTSLTLLGISFTLFLGSRVQFQRMHTKADESHQTLLQGIERSAYIFCAMIALLGVFGLVVIGIQALRPLFP